MAKPQPRFHDDTCDAIPGQIVKERQEGKMTCPSKKEILRICAKNEKEFARKVKRLGYSIKGIFNSEMLLFISLAEHFGVSRIIESGRARGHSTAIIAQWFTDVISIEYDRYTKDAFIAQRRLRPYSRIQLLFGDARKLAPPLTTKKCCVLIDGPKGDDAILLALKLLQNKHVRAVFIHDLHKASPHRSIVENIFHHTFFTDDRDFVKRFKYLDDHCWKEQAKHKKPGTWAPYLRRGQKIESYSSTLAAIFNRKNAINNNAAESYRKELRKRRASKLLRHYILQATPKKVLSYLKRRIADPLYWFVRIKLA